MPQVYYDIEKRIKLCKYCKKEIPIDASKCPHCRKNQTNKNILVIIVVIILLGSLMSYYSDGGNSHYNSNITIENNNNLNVQDNIANLSDVVNYNGVLYSILDVTKSSGNKFNTPDDGNEYVIVKIRIENLTDSVITYNPYDWTIINSYGQESDKPITCTIDSETSLDAGKLRANGYVEGTISFEQPINDNALYFCYYENAYSSNPTFAFKLFE